MRSTFRWSASTAAALATLLLAAGCGDVSVTPKSGSSDDSGSSPSPSAAAPDTSAGKGDWLLAITSAGGADAEKSTTTYVTYNPSTGTASARKLPGVTAASANPQQSALLVSTDRRWAIPDTGIARAQEKSGVLKVYSLADGSTKTLDLRALAGRKDLNPIGWAFDPQRADTLRVVDTQNRVWAVKVSGGKATQESTLPKGPWVFTNGFDYNSGQPWVESIESDATKPPGNGPSDQRPLTRAGGTVLPSGSAGLSKLPQSPCRLAAGFTDSADLTWAFCADDASVKAYYLPKGGQQWTAYGKPSTPVAPIAAGFPLVLPPVE